MKYCSKCGKAVKEDAKFCPYCGHDLTIPVPDEIVEPEKSVEPPKPKESFKFKKPLIMASCVALLICIVGGVLVFVGSRGDGGLGSMFSKVHYYSQWSLDPVPEEQRSYGVLEMRPLSASTGNFPEVTLYLYAGYTASGKEHSIDNDEYFEFSVEQYTGIGDETVPCDVVSVDYEHDLPVEVVILADSYTVIDSFTNPRRSFLVSFCKSYSESSSSGKENYNPNSLFSLYVYGTKPHMVCGLKNDSRDVSDFIFDIPRTFDADQHSALLKTLEDTFVSSYADGTKCLVFLSGQQAEGDYSDVIEYSQRYNIPIYVASSNQDDILETVATKTGGKFFMIDSRAPASFVSPLVNSLKEHRNAIKLTVKSHDRSLSAGDRVKFGVSLLPNVHAVSLNYTGSAKFTAVDEIMSDTVFESNRQDIETTANRIQKEYDDRKSYKGDTTSFVASPPVVMGVPLSWEAANSECKRLSGHLAVIESEEEFQYITARAEELGLEYLWIGAKVKIVDELAELHWVNDEPFGYVRWDKSEPAMPTRTEGAEKYVMLQHLGFGSGWVYRTRANDILIDYPSMADELGYVLEYDY